MTTERQPLTIERLERALAVAAYLVTRHGMKAVPIFEKLERELAIMRSSSDTMDRAKRLLDIYRTAGGAKAIA